MNWRPISEKPQTEEPVTALIATRDEEGDGLEPFYLVGIYLWRGGRWIDEDTGRPLPAGSEYWWLAELELLQDLQKALAG